MKTSTLVFYTETDKQVHLFRLPADGIVPTHQCYSHSVVISIAAYMVWKYPFLAPPGVNIPFKPKFRQENFPDRLAVTHPMHDYWVEILLQIICNKGALRSGDTLFLKLKINQTYAQTLKNHGFSMQIFQGEFSWDLVSSELDQQKLRATQKKKLVMILTCAVNSIGRGSFNAPAILTGLLFNNQNWKTFRIMNNEFPTKQDYQNVTQVIVPGSTLCISINIEPNIMKLIDQLRALFVFNKNVKYLGICYGHQLLSQVLNPGSVRRAQKGTFGQNKVAIIQSQTTQRYSFLKGLNTVNLYQVHNDEVVCIPDGFIKIAESQGCGVQMMVSNDGRIFTMQAHPQYTPARYRSIVALHKLSRNQVTQQDVLQLVSKQNEMQDQSLIGQQICRRFVSQ